MTFRLFFVNGTSLNDNCEAEFIPHQATFLQPGGYTILLWDKRCGVEATGNKIVKTDPELGVLETSIFP